MMMSAANLLADMSLDNKLIDATTLTIVGVVTVVVCLWLIGDIFVLLRKLLSPKSTRVPLRTVPLRPAAVAPATVATPAPAKPVAPLAPLTQPVPAPQAPILQGPIVQGIEAHLIPIITAAAAAVIGRPVVVHRITFINSNTVSGWAEAGRTSIHQSHNLRRN
jgi:hypothetical protein